MSRYQDSRSASRSVGRTLGTLVVMGGLVLSACGDAPSASAPAPDVTLIQDDAVGVSLSIPKEWEMRPDAVLFDKSYGLLISGEDSDPSMEGPHDREPIARIALVYGASPDQLEALVQEQFDAHKDIPGLQLSRSEVEVGNGLRGVAVTGLPGTQPYSAVYVASGEQLYEIGLWTSAPGLDARAHSVLRSLRFTPPTRSVHSLGLQSEKESLYWEPSGEMARRSQEALEERRRAGLEDVKAGLIIQGPHEIQALPELPVSAMSSACNFVWAPYGTDMQWQTMWDRYANFYGSLGWTRMSGNGGSWWGQGFHVSCSDPYYHNQHFANDWPLQFGANVYSPFSGTVRYAGWAQGGHYTLGRIVIIRNGAWGTLAAHLRGWGPGISAGVWVDAYWDVIGYAGNSDGGAGYNWAPHLHNRVTYKETYSGNGMPIGGQTVKPRAWRCFNCTDHDEKTADGRKWYTNFYKDRWMRD
jgi:murein DD-endopeptidase MepM/ murein hydrolase activator NlpD